MKKTLCFMLIIVMAFSFSACASKNSDSSTVNRPDESSTPQTGNGIVIVDNRNKDNSENTSSSASESSTPSTPEPTKHPGADVYEAFLKATTLQKKDLKTDVAGAYCYKGIRLSEKDIEEILGDYAISQSAIYNGVARKMEQICANDGFLFNSSDDAFYQILLGENKPQTYEEFKVLARTLGKYIVYDPTEREIFQAFESLDCVVGEIDTENRTYSFTINDLAKTAASLHVSEEMLGYMIAYTAIYPPSPDAFQWGENSVTVNFYVGIPPTLPAMRSYDVDDPTYIYSDGFNYCCSDFTYALNDILMQLDRDMRTSKSSSYGHASYIFNANTGASDVVILYFSDPSKDPLDAKDEFLLLLGEWEPDTEDLVWAHAITGMIMASDPKLSYDEATDLGSTILGEPLEDGTTDFVKRDGLAYTFGYTDTGLYLSILGDQWAN